MASITLKSAAHRRAVLGALWYARVSPCAERLNQAADIAARDFLACDDGFEVVRPALKAEEEMRGEMADAVLVVEVAVGRELSLAVSADDLVTSLQEYRKTLGERSVDECGRAATGDALDQLDAVDELHEQLGWRSPQGIAEVPA